MNPSQQAQLAAYLPWFKLLGVPILFLLLRFTRQGLRRRIDEIGYRTMGTRGLLLWFWLNAPGVILHELSHAFVVLLFYPFGFRITSVTLFRIQAKTPPRTRVAARSNKQTSGVTLQLGEVQYVRPHGRLMTYIGDGFSGIAPLFGGIAMFLLLYWVATGYTLWDNIGPHLQFHRPGWPWWTLIFAPYLILTVTSELWPSRADWHGARWLVWSIVVLSLLALGISWYVKYLVIDDALLISLSSVAIYLDFALAVLLALDLVFLFVAEGIVQMMRK